MKKKGIVLEYDGYYGKILSDGNEYVVLKKDIINFELLNVNDEVTFIAEKVVLTNEERLIARFVSKI